MPRKYPEPVIRRNEDGNHVQRIKVETVGMRRFQRRYKRFDKREICLYAFGLTWIVVDYVSEPDQTVLKPLNPVPAPGLRHGIFCKTAQPYNQYQKPLHHTRSNTRALAPPPPLHIPATPIRAFCCSSTESSVTTMRAPEAPSGWPSETAPPLTFTRSAERSSSLLLAMATTENASLISKKSTSSMVMPARSSARGIALAGDVVNHSG